MEKGISQPPNVQLRIWDIDSRSVRCNDLNLVSKINLLLYIKLNGSFNTAANDSLFLILFSHETRSLGLHHQKIRFNCFNSSFDWELLSSIVNICSILFPFCTSLEGINSNACINSRQQTADSMTLKWNRCYHLEFLLDLALLNSVSDFLRVSFLAFWILKHGRKW